MSRKPTEKQRKFSLLQTVFARNSVDVVETSMVDYRSALQNINRQQVLQNFRKELLFGLNKVRPRLAQDEQHELGHRDEEFDYIYELAKNVTDWVIQRHSHISDWVKMRQNKGKELIRCLDNYHWCLLGIQSQSKDVDRKIWDKYAKQVEERIEDMPEADDPNFEEVALMKEKANAYFLDKLQETVKNSKLQDLVEGSLHITQLSTFMKLFSFLLPQILSMSAPKQFQDEILPKICIYALVSRKSFTGPMLEALLKRCQSHVTSDLVNSIIEYSSYSINLNLIGFCIDTFKQHIRTEGILCGLLAATIKGNKHIMAIFQLHVIEKLQEVYDKENGVYRFELNAELDNFSQFVPPFIYILFAASCDAVHAVTNVVSDLIQFYEKDPLKEILVEGGISDSLHYHFVDGIFNWACKLNHYNAVETLLESSWVKSNYVTPIVNAVSEGHQKILHVLLKTLLSPDPSFELPYGAIPLCFRKNEALKLLPMIANRFPTEAAWFINSISNIPIPVAIPPTEDTDPVVKSKSVDGIRLGSAKLTEVIVASESRIPHEYIWSKLDRVGQLHRISARVSGEVESVICMVPDILLKEPALRENARPSSFGKETNSLIRLLETEEEEIILSPIVQSLMEYHWGSGYFWFRFGYQFLSMVCFILVSTVLFSNPEMPHALHYCLTAIIYVLSLMFLAQEVRQCLNNSKEYIKSASNLVDVCIYTLTVVVVSLNSFSEAIEIHPLVKALIVLFSTMRLLLHLRIFPSVGPIVRITSSALLNVLPILVPMSFLLAAYSAAFYIVHQDLVGKSTNFYSFFQSMQYTTTMITFDYTMLQQPSLFPVFLLRIMFHATFLICFINLIVALMTVNIADVTSNMQAAWLIEISQLMIELELYWPRPFSYPKTDIDYDNSEAPSMTGSIVALDAFKRFSMVHRNNNSSRNSKDVHDLNVILYTAPREAVCKSCWWTDFPKVEKSPNTIGASMFDLDFEFDIKDPGNPTTFVLSNPITIPILEADQSFSERGSVNPLNQDANKESVFLTPAEEDVRQSSARKLDRSSSGLSWLKTHQTPSFNAGSGLKRRLSLNPSSARNTAAVPPSPKMVLGKQVFSDKPLNAAVLLTQRMSNGNPVDSLNSINEAGVQAAVSNPILTTVPPISIDNNAMFEHIQQLEKTVKYEFKKNRELFFKVEEALQNQQQRQGHDAIVVNPTEDLIKLIKDLQKQVESLQKRPTTWMERIFGAGSRQEIARRSYSMPYTKTSSKQTYPADYNV